MILLSDGILLESSSKEKQMKLFSNGSKVNLKVEQIETVVENYNGKIYYNASSKEVVNMIIGSKALRSRLMYPMMRSDDNLAACYNWMDTTSRKDDTTGWHAGSDTTLGRILATAVNRFICSGGAILDAYMITEDNGTIEELRLISSGGDLSKYIEIQNNEIDKRKFAIMLDICNRNKATVAGYKKYSECSGLWIKQSGIEHININLIREIGEI